MQSLLTAACTHSTVTIYRRKTREAKQYSKQVQAEKQKERTAAKKKQIESVTNMRKQREKSVSGNNAEQSQNGDKSCCLPCQEEAD